MVHSDLRNDAAFSRATCPRAFRELAEKPAEFYCDHVGHWCADGLSVGDGEDHAEELADRSTNHGDTISHPLHPVCLCGGGWDFYRDAVAVCVTCCSL